MDMYKNLDTRSIKSQINEQVNAGLQRIKGQLAYMKPRDSYYLFSWLLKNQNNIREVDVSILSI